LRQPLEGGAAAERRHVREDRQHALPRRQEPSERLRLDRFDLVPQPRQRAPPEYPQDLRIAPLALGARGPELAADDGPRAGQTAERILDDTSGQAPARGRLAGEEWAVGAGPA